MTKTRSGPSVLIVHFVGHPTPSCLLSSAVPPCEIDMRLLSRRARNITPYCLGCPVAYAGASFRCCCHRSAQRSPLAPERPLAGVLALCWLGISDMFREDATQAYRGDVANPSSSVPLACLNALITVTHLNMCSVAGRLGQINMHQ